VNKVVCYHYRAIVADLFHYIANLAWNWISVYLLARLQTWRAIIFSRVCLSVCLYVCVSVCVCVCVCVSDRHFYVPFNGDRFWRNLVTRTLLWSSLAATIMVEIGRRGGPRDAFLKISKNSQKSQNSNFKILVHHFLRLCLLCIVKNIRLDSNKTDGGDRFWSLPLWRFRQWHCCSSMMLGGIFWLNWRHGSVQRSKLGGFGTGVVRNWGRSELRAQSGRKKTGLFNSHLSWVLVHYYWHRIFIFICTGAIAHDICTTFLNT